MAVSVDYVAHVRVLCDKQGCGRYYEVTNCSETMVLSEARKEGWKTDLVSRAARCPEHKDSGGASLLALGSGAL